MYHKKYIETYIIHMLCIYILIEEEKQNDHRFLFQ